MSTAAGISKESSEKAAKKRTRKSAGKQSVMNSEKAAENKALKISLPTSAEQGWVRFEPIATSLLRTKLEPLRIICLTDGRVLLEADAAGKSSRDVFFKLENNNIYLSYRNTVSKTEVDQPMITNTNISDDIYRGCLRLVSPQISSAIEKYDWYAWPTLDRGNDGRQRRSLFGAARKNWDEKDQRKFSNFCTKMRDVRGDFLRILLGWAVRTLHPDFDVYCQTGEPGEYVETKIENLNHVAIKHMIAGTFPKSKNAEESTAVDDTKGSEDAHVNGQKDDGTTRSDTVKPRPPEGTNDETDQAKKSTKQGGDGEDTTPNTADSIPQSIQISKRSAYDAGFAYDKEQEAKRWAGILADNKARREARLLAL